MSYFKILKLTDFENRILQVMVDEQIKSLNFEIEGCDNQTKEFIEAKICILQNIFEKLEVKSND